MQLGSLELQLCDIQGRLFENSLKQQLKRSDFIPKFMNSETAAYFDLPYDRLQWAGEEYILENLLEEVPVCKEAGSGSREEMYWTGYTYRYWHFLTGESSREIYAQADEKVMQECYPAFHTMDICMAVEDLKEIYCERKKESQDKQGRM